jgi:2-methylcitrate dehydratase PrpD
LTKPDNTPLGVADFGPAFRRDVEITRLASSVEFVREPKFDALFPAAAPGRVRLFAGDKVIFESELECESGNPKRPMSSEELLAKFDGNCRKWSRQSRRSVIDAIDRLGQSTTRQLMLEIDRAGRS